MQTTLSFDVQPNQTHTNTLCKTSLKYSNAKICPQPSVIQMHLKENTGFDGSIKPNDKVCYTCFGLHTKSMQGYSVTVETLATKDTHLPRLCTA